VGGPPPSAVVVADTAIPVGAVTRR
jgi:hypothetical protein